MLLEKLRLFKDFTIAGFNKLCKALITALDDTDLATLFLRAAYVNDEVLGNAAYKEFVKRCS